MKILKYFIVILFCMIFLSAGNAFARDGKGEAKKMFQIALKLFKAGKYAESIPYAQRALDIVEKDLGPYHPKTASYLNNLALLYRKMGDYAHAAPLIKRAHKIKEKTLGPDHPETINYLNNLAVLYSDMGDYTRAAPLYKRALKIRKKALGPKHPLTAQSLGNLADLYERMGDYDRAKPLYERALKIKEKKPGPNHPDTAVSLNSLAGIYRKMGDYGRAKLLYERALKIREKTPGPDSLDTATSLNNLAVLYVDMGDYAKALPLHKRATKIRVKTLGLEHLSTATSFNNLATLYIAMGEYSWAFPLLKKTLKIIEKVLGPRHPDTAASLNNLAALYQSMDDYARAGPLYKRALKIRKKALGPDHPDTATSLNNLAVLYKDMGDYARAGPLYKRALKISEKTLDPGHPDTATFLKNLAVFNVSQNKNSIALEYFKKTLSIEDSNIQNIFTVTTEKQKLKYIQSIKSTYLAGLSLIHQELSGDRKAVRFGLELVLRRKGIVFEAQSRAREGLKGRLSESARKDFEKLASLRSELSRLLLNKPEKMNHDGYKKRINSLHAEIGKTENRLSQESALVAKKMEQRNVTVKAVARALPKDHTLVEFVKIQDIDFPGNKWGPWRYLAFVLKPDGEVTLVDLGAAETMDKKAGKVRDNIHAQLDHPNTKSRRMASSLNVLYQTLWSPLEGLLDTSQKILLSPDGMLNLIPFNALLDKDGKSLIERYQIAYLSSGRELVGGLNKIQPESELLLLANPAYDKKLSPGKTEMYALRSRGFNGRFSPLPGTAIEARELPALLSSNTGKQQVLQGEDATEGAVKRSRSPRILHLATHGFFLKDQREQFQAGSRGILVGPKTVSKEYENPLVRSGLAFAGANHASEVTAGDDGILTALEVTSMDLYGTRLVVLSACETAVGKVLSGEGVFGLRRAFSLAGARNLLMSLWPVSDEITVSQMKSFYQAIGKNIPLAEALRKAQLDTIKELKAKHGTAPTALWAPFILQGVPGQAIFSPF